MTKIGLSILTHTGGNSTLYRRITAICGLAQIFTSLNRYDKRAGLVEAPLLTVDSLPLLLFTPPTPTIVKVDMKYEYFLSNHSK